MSKPSPSARLPAFVSPLICSMTLGGLLAFACASVSPSTRKLSQGCCRVGWAITEKARGKTGGFAFGTVRVGFMELSARFWGLHVKKTPRVMAWYCCLLPKSLRVLHIVLWRSISTDSNLNTWMETERWFREERGHECRPTAPLFVMILAIQTLHRHVRFSPDLWPKPSPPS